MARGINKVQLIGNAVRDPDVRFAPDGTAIARVSIATNESWKDAKSGERKERAEYHNVVLFGRTAEIAGEYLRKGTLVYLEGSLRTNKWQDDNGIDRWTTEIRVRDMQMLGGNRSENGNASPSEKAASKSASPSDAPTTTQAPAAPTKASKPAAATSQKPAKATPEPALADDDDFDDDIPFVRCDYAGQPVTNDAATLLSRSDNNPAVW